MKPRTSFVSSDTRFHICFNCCNPDSSHTQDGERYCPVEFTLVNENPGKGQVVLEKDYTRDDLIAMIGKAYLEFVDLVKEMQSAKATADAASAACLELNEAITGDKATGEKWMDVAKNHIGFLKQCENVLKNLVENVPADKCKEVVLRVWKRISGQGYSED